LLYTLLLPPLLFSFPHSFTPHFKVTPPHCIKTPSIVAHPSKGEGPLKSLEMHFSIGLHTTVCFRLEDTKENSTESSQSLLHTVTLARIEHHHPVTQKYNFGIPEVRADCFCECESTARCSSSTYEFLKCPEAKEQNHGCYRTFFPNQSNKSCETSSPMGSNLCCDLKFNPYENKTYTAVRLGEPATFAIFTYVSYDYSANSWIERDKNTIRIQIDGRSQENTLDPGGLLKLVVSAWGRVSHQLESGMYFTQSNPGGEMEGIRKEQINDITDTNVHQLGWYRQDERSGHFYVQNGAVIAKSVHGAKVVDCKEQIYSSSLAANFYMPGRFSLPPYVEERHHWIERAAFYDGSMRQVIVSHSEGTNLYIGLHVAKGSEGNVVFLHNSSRIESFDGSILVDSHSRHYLNLSLSEATGKLNGIIHASESVASPQIHSFSVFVHEVFSTNRSLLVPLPATVDRGAKLVCMRAEEEKEEDSFCAVLPYHEEALEIDVENNSWREWKGRCPECNHISYNSFIDNLNPLKLFGGFQSLGDGFTKAADFLIYIIGLVILYLLITKFILPVCQCCVCPLLVARINDRRAERRRNGDEEERKEIERERRIREQLEAEKERRRNRMNREELPGDLV
ncbi:hypothetical protein PMAYCL1PPCAC_06667, partial [Pristionchus mayeri]